ncbi:MAG: Gfo/Idh/MocA family oxidoreductase [Candidatus Solibacter sp.]|jgi:predicted dehydrogenase
MTNNISRRKLFQAAALVPYAAVRGTAANSAVKVGLIGSGGRGTFDAGLLVKNTPARLVAICDIFDDRLKKAALAIPAPDAKQYKNMNELLASDVDAVIIATPVFLHPEHFEAAIKAGKHIYIEKPAGVDVDGCKRVIRAADSADRRLNITFGFQQRHGQVYLKAKQLLDSGAIGPIRMAHAHWIKGAFRGDEAVMPRPQTYEDKIRQWHVWRDTFGDIIVETYCHGIDVLNWFLGSRPTSAYGTGGRTVEKRGDIMDHCDVTFSYPNQVQAVLTGAQMTPVFYRSVNEQFFGANSVIETAREYWTHYRGKGDVVTEKSPREITIDSLADFVQRIAEGRPDNSGVRAAESTLTAIMGRMAIDQKREVTWEEMMRS